MIENKDAIKKFLSEYPWNESDIGRLGSLDTLWKFDIAAPRREVWDHLIDTSLFNKLLGLPEMHFTEEDGKLYGELTMLGQKSAWVEEPWEWEYLRRFRNVRRYSSGFAHVLRTIYDLEPLEDTKTRIRLYLGWIPRSRAGKAILGLVMRNAYKTYESVISTIEETLAKNKTFSEQKRFLYNQTHDTPMLTENATALLKAASEKLIQDYGLSEEPVNSLFDHLRTAPDEELDRIQIKPLSERWGIPYRELLRTALYSTREGILSLSWDIVCPHCRGVRNEIQSLGALPAQSNCDVCQIEFSAGKLNTIEVTFRIHSSIRRVEKRMYCAAEPATKKHILYQVSVHPGRTLEIPELPWEGNYRQRILGKKQMNLLELKDHLENKHLVITNDMSDTALEAGSGSSLRFKNAGEEPLLFILERRKEDQDALRPRDLFLFQDFRDIFSREALAVEVQLEVGVQTLLFTDIVGSSSFYEEQGDSRAFSYVKRHFEVIYEAVRRGGGAVAKTIGDSAMAAFEKPLDAVRTAVALQRWFERQGDRFPVSIRITIHQGKCLAVNLNSGIDYFGEAVNLTAKLQNYTDAGEIVLSKRVMDDLAVKGLLKRLGYRVVRRDVDMNWSARTFQTFKLKIY